MLVADGSHIRCAQSEEDVISTIAGAVGAIHLRTLGLILKVTWERFS